MVGNTKVVARFAGGTFIKYQVLFLKVSIVLKADFIANRTNVAFLSWWSFTLKTLVSYNNYFCSISSKISSRCSVIAMLILSFFSLYRRITQPKFISVYTPSPGTVARAIQRWLTFLDGERLHLRKIWVEKWAWKGLISLLKVSRDTFHFPFKRKVSFFSL